MKAYRVEIIVVDHEGHGPDELMRSLENMKYYNPDILSITEAEIGKWSDDHVLNCGDSKREDKLKFFNII